MAIESRVGTKVIKNLRREEAAGTRVDPYPYIGIVKNNLDPTRSGRVQVWIPDLGGPQDDPGNWRTVSYASPFMGATSQVYKSTDTSPTTNTFTTVNHSYGMWMVPPDIGVQVIVLFIAGDPLRGYWLACVSDNLSHYMIPAVAGTASVDSTSLSDADKRSYAPGDVVPVVEFNEYIGKDFTAGDFYNIAKPIHETQYNILQGQGLEKDPLRGAITSSSQRESPSYVFGISTPGRPLKDPADDPTYQDKLNSGNLPPDYFTVKSRKGGHTFIMDDGDSADNNQLVRLRSAAGHQILLNDSENFLYVANAEGTSWLEFSADGSINLFATNGFNLRSQAAINLHSDTDINLNAKRSINMKTGTFQLDSTTTNLYTDGPFNFQSTGNAQFNVGGELTASATGQISLKAGGIVAVDGSSWYLQSGKSKAAGTVTPLTTNSLPDAKQNANQIWQSTPGALTTIVTAAPTHEPYTRVTPPNEGTAAIQPGPYTGKVDSTKNAQGQGVQNPAGATDIRKQPPATGVIGPLTSDMLTAYFAQIGKSESGGNYQAVNTIGYVGKYQFGFAALQTYGYVKTSCKNNAALNNANSWTGKNGMDSLQTWLNSPGEQENAMFAYTKGNYNSMCKIGAISDEQNSPDVGGMCAVAHLLGPGGAKNYRNGASGADQYGTTGGTYYNKGYYAVSVLSPTVPSVLGG